MNYYKIPTITGKKELTRVQLEEMIYFILSTGQVELGEIPYLFGYDTLKDLDNNLDRFLRVKVKHSAFRIAKHLFGDEVVCVKK